MFVCLPLFKTVSFLLNVVDKESESELNRTKSPALAQKSSCRRMSVFGSMLNFQNTFWGFAQVLEFYRGNVLWHKCSLSLSFFLFFSFSFFSMQMNTVRVLVSQLYFSLFLLKYRSVTSVFCCIRCLSVEYLGKQMSTSDEVSVPCINSRTWRGIYTSSL